jgi:hypothetical protein
LKVEYFRIQQRVTATAAAKWAIIVVLAGKNRISGQRGRLVYTDKSIQINVIFLLAFIMNEHPLFQLMNRFLLLYIDFLRIM